MNPIGGDTRKVEPLAAREDGDRNLLRLGRREDELHMRRRLFERFEQRVERLRRDHVDFVDDVDLEARSRGAIGDGLAEFADVLDAVVGGAVDFENVDVLAGGDRLARVANAARSSRRAFLAVERLGEHPRHRRLADAAGAGEEIGMSDAAGDDRLLQRFDDDVLTDEIFEPLRPITASEDGVAFRRSIGCLDWLIWLPGSDGRLGFPLRHPHLDIGRRSETWEGGRGDPTRIRLRV